MAQIPLDNLDLSLQREHDARLQALGREQVFRQRLLDRVAIECAMMQRQIALIHNSRISAISSLPEEILAEIFTFSHRSQSLSHHPTSGARDTHHRSNKFWRAEIALSSVCSRWRTHTLGMRSLWSVFWCDQPSSYSRLIGELARLRTYLQRSGTHTLELFFDFTCPEPYEPESSLSMVRFKELVQEMLSMAVAHVERWKQISIIADDARGRVPDVPLKGDIWAPKLERMVICTGKLSGMGRVTEDGGWNPQVLSRNTDRRGSCPALRYLKLDRAGLQSCRPCITQLTHLVLEYGNVGLYRNENEFTIEWPALVNILRSTRLETLSLCERVLCSNTFPNLPSDPKYQLQIPKLRHLRLGSASRFNGWGGPPSKLFWFLLRYVAASSLETLEIVSFIVGRSPWANSAIDPWPIPNGSALAFNDIHTFPSLRLLALSEIKVLNQDETGPLGFLLLERMTRSAQSLILSDHQSSLRRIISGEPPFGRYANPPFPGDDLWAHATDISIDFEIRENGSNARNAVRLCLVSCASWCMRVSRRWKDIQILRLPPIWLDMWLARLKQPICVNKPRAATGWIFDFAEGGLMEEEDGNSGDVLEPTSIYNVLIEGHPVKIVALKEVIPLCWPPGSESTTLNTLESEQFEPFKVEFGDFSAAGTVYE